MKRNRNVRALCLAVLLGLSVPLTGWAAKPHAEAMQAKTDDPVFVVPKAANPIPAEAVKGLQIREENGRWLVSDKALQQYGIYAADEKKGTYWFQLPPDAQGQKRWQNTRVSLMLPGQAVQQERTVNIRYIRRPLGISYVLENDSKSLLPPAQPTRVIPQLRQTAEPIEPAKHTAKEEKMDMVLFWDPVMNENQELPALQTKQPIMSPCALRLSEHGLELRHPDFAMLAASYRDKGYSMWPLVDNHFDPKLTHAVLQNEPLQEQIIKEMIGYALLYEFKGYNLDFENVNYADKNGLTAFVKKISDACHAYGVQVSMDVTFLSDSPNWSLVYDRKALADSLDYMMVMAYDQYGRTSPVAGPVASYPWVEKGIEALLPQVRPDKIILGMPLYMRLWYESKNGKDLPKDMAQWPTVEGEAKAVAEKDSPAAAKKQKTKLFVRTLTMADSEALMKKYKNHVVWDETLQAYYLELPLQTGTVKVWFEEEKSLKKKAELVPKYGLGGACFWRKGFETHQFWQRFAKHELT